MARVSVAQQKARRLAVIEGIAAGKGVQQIADELGVHRSTITGDLRAITDNFGAWADGETRSRQLTAMANLQAVINAAWAGYDEALRIKRKWLAGAYDRTELYPDADGGYREVRKAPVLKQDEATYLDKIIKATEALCKLTGIAAPEKINVHTTAEVTVTHEVEDLDDAFNRITDPAQRAAFIERVRAVDEAARVAEAALAELGLPPAQ